MRRHAQLQPLSRAHHQTLRFARQLKQGQWNMTDLREKKIELSRHFTEEEDSFSSLVYGLPDTHPIMAQLSRMIFDHIVIMAMISCIEHSKSMNDSGVGTSSFGIGSDFDETMMKGIADKGNGTYFFIDEAHEIPSIVDKGTNI